MIDMNKLDDMLDALMSSCEGATLAAQRIARAAIMQYVAENAKGCRVVPFDEAAARAGAAIQVDGADVRFVGTNSAGCVVFEDASGAICLAHIRAVTMKPREMRTMWINLYQSGRYGSLHETEDRARAAACSDAEGDGATQYSVQVPK